MPEPSNTGLFNTGHVELKPDFSRSILSFSVHFVTIHMQPKEVLSLIFNLFAYGVKLWGVAWANGVLLRLEKVNLDPPSISVPNGAQVKAMGEDV